MRLIPVTSVKTPWIRRTYLIVLLPAIVAAYIGIHLRQGINDCWRDLKCGWNEYIP